MIMTFTLGLASVFVTTGSLQQPHETFVNLPTTESGEVILVFTKCRFEMPYAGGSGPHYPDDWLPPKKVGEKAARCLENH